mgnify:CR=1 FL=1
MGYDTQPLVTLEDKDRFFDDVVKNDHILFFEHDLYNECCNLQDTPKGVKVKDVFSLDQFLQNN